MNNAPLTCSGNDLAAVCADIRLRGGCIEAMDVIGKAMYRVSYFVSAWRNIQTRPLIGSINRCTGTHRRDEISPASVCHAGENPAALNHLPKPMHSKNVAAGGETRAEKLKSVPDAPASISSEWRKHQAALVGLVGERVHVAAPVEVVSASAEINPPSLLTSIEDRMSALQSKLLASGKIRRSKPKTEARLPHAD